ncbi:hypothetical protein E2562_029059 [Oryza meyeriana var. granulata]|uniref:At1g61320/AtMIF1 LRR domain-containing protein n=1 Tax=Oryza meyeriana var. granulata TaxID=110450 RepID=A0A6G1CU47_9ORYZ|nr:hypothetical protein E2562_029059 [Oryza meyeriana var. granulata]
MQQLLMENVVVAKRSRLEHHRALIDGLSFRVEDLPEKATLNFSLDEDINKVLGHAFRGIPSVSAVKVLNVHANIYAKQLVWSSQVHTLTARPTFMFMNLRHLTYEILIFTKSPNSHSGILQLGQYLAFAPQLETLELHMLYHVIDGHCWHGEGVSYHMPRHDHLKTVYMSGFRCYRAQVELLCGILEMGAALEHVTIDPMTRISYSLEAMNIVIPEDEIRQWAYRTSERFGAYVDSKTNIHMLYHVIDGHCWHGEGVSYHMPRHDHLKTVYMSGFRCYRAQVELLCGILEMGAALEHVTIDPMTRISYSLEAMNIVIPEDEIRQWAYRTSERFGKAIIVVKCPELQWW